MIDNGWIKARRFWWSSRLFKRRPGDRLSPFEFWIWLCFEANWDDNPRHNPPLFRGDLLSTRGKLAKVANWTTSEVRSFLDRVERAGLIKTRAIGRGTVISIVDYESAQPAPNQRSTSAQPAPTYTEESRTKNQTSGDKSPAGDVFDESGELWPKPKPGRMSYPQNFARIWEVWRRAQKAAPGVVKAAGKGNAYDLCRGHISRGSTSEEMRSAAIRYLTSYTSKRETVGCFQPSRFYRASGPEFLEYLDAPESGSGTASTRERWRRPSDAWRECAALSSHFGLDLPKMPERNHGPQWEDVEAFHPLILKWAPDLHGFKTPPGDLKEQIAGGENGSC